MLRIDKVKRSGRHRVVLNVPVRVGSKNGTLVDISDAGILATHTGTLKAGSVIAIDFTSSGRRFVGSGRVETCTVIGLGTDADDTGGTVYASRIFFSELSPESREILAELMKA